MSSLQSKEKKYNRDFRGIIRLYIGPMFCGKTSSLIEGYTRHEIGQRKCLLVKNSRDARYSVSNIVAHDGKSVASTVCCKLLCEIDHLVGDFHVICIDEVQFFDDAHIFCDKWANQGLIVEAAGLCGTYTRSIFPVMAKLLPRAEEIIKKVAVCRETCKDASFTKRITNDTDVVIIGGSDMYKPVDRKTYFTECKNTQNNDVDVSTKEENTLTRKIEDSSNIKKQENIQTHNDIWNQFKNYEVNEFIEFVSLYTSQYKIQLSIEQMIRIKNYFIETYKKFNCYLNVFNEFISAENSKTQK